MQFVRSAQRLTVLALLLALTACASTTEFLRTSTEARPAHPAHRLFVAGVSTDDRLRARYEAVFVQELQRAGLEGIASHALIPTTNGLTMAEIREKMHAAAGSADAVVHVQLVGIVTTPAMSPTDIPADSAPATRDVNGISLTINAPPPGNVGGSQREAELQANLYELPSRRLLWTAITRTREANTVEDIARSHARALIKAMRAGGYVDARP